MHFVKYASSFLYYKIVFMKIHIFENIMEKRNLIKDYIKVFIKYRRKRYTSNVLYL